MKHAFLAGILAAIAIAQPAVAETVGADDTGPRAFEDPLAVFGEMFERIRTAYVDDISDAELMKAAIDGMLASLDPHSTYLPPTEYEALRAQTRGAFGGVGVEVSDEAGAVTIMSTTEGAPADRAGIRAGDVITHLDGMPVAGLPLRETSARIRGEVGSVVEITISRTGASEPFAFAVTRESIRVRAVRGSLERGVVVLKITGFNEQTHAMLREQFDARLAEAGGLGAVHGVIIDLRDNRGGLLDQAVKVSDAFLDTGDIVTTRGRVTGRTGHFRAEAGDLAAGKPVVVLVNGRSASASEIVAGALQDNGRALVLGTQSFGKGSVQTIMALPRAGAMKLTTSRYYTPSGRSIQALGIAPDIIVEAAPASEPDADTQLAHALDLVRGISLLQVRDLGAAGRS